MKNPRTLLILFVLGIAAVVGWWLKEQLAPESLPYASARRQAPDYSLQTFTLTGMSQQGQPRYQLRADSMVHYPEDDHSDLEKPDLLFFRENEPPWHVNAEKGKVYQQGELVKLLGKVIIKRPPSPANGPVTITTYNLTVHPEDEYAETDESVHMSGNATDLKGIGMKVFLKEGRIQLLDKVKGVHVPVQN